MFLILDLCDYVDLDEDVFGEGFNGNAGACGFAGEIFSVNLVEGGEVIHIGKETNGFDRLFDIGACGL